MSRIHFVLGFFSLATQQVALSPLKLHLANLNCEHDADRRRPELGSLAWSPPLAVLPARGKVRLAVDEARLSRREIEILLAAIGLPPIWRPERRARAVEEPKVLIWASAVPPRYWLGYSRHCGEMSIQFHVDAKDALLKGMLECCFPWW
jgi:hypothetical protein